MAQSIQNPLPTAGDSGAALSAHAVDMPTSLPATHSQRPSAQVHQPILSHVTPVQVNGVGSSGAIRQPGLERAALLEFVLSGCRPRTDRDDCTATCPRCRLETGTSRSASSSARLRDLRTAGDDMRRDGPRATHARSTPASPSTARAPERCCPAKPGQTAYPNALNPHGDASRPDAMVSTTWRATMIVFVAGKLW
jgi:hypothetical protein